MEDKVQYKRQLINLVKKRPILYNRGGKKKQVARRDGWLDLAREMFPAYKDDPDRARLWAEKAAVLQTEWKSLRDHFVKVHKRLGNSSNKKSKYSLYDAMEFYIQHIQKKSSTKINGEERKRDNVTPQLFPPCDSDDEVEIIEGDGEEKEDKVIIEKSMMERYGEVRASTSAASHQMEIDSAAENGLGGSKLSIVVDEGVEDRFGNMAYIISIYPYLNGMDALTSIDVKQNIMCSIHELYKDDSTSRGTSELSFSRQLIVSMLEKETVAEDRHGNLIYLMAIYPYLNSMDLSTSIHAKEKIMQNIREAYGGQNSAQTGSIPSSPCQSTSNYEGITLKLSPGISGPRYYM